MKPVELSEILDLATYEKRRPEVRGRILEAKRARRVHVGEALTFLFENRDTVLYQVQEMARAERLFRDAELRHEIDTYNELLGKPGELGCALLIEIEDPRERDRRLCEWRALPEHLYVRTPSGRKVHATYDSRQIGEERLSSVQYLKFDTGGEVPVAIGSDLPALAVEATLTDEQRAALAADLASDR